MLLYYHNILLELIYVRRVYAKIKGSVQGVGFRFFAQTLAMDLNLSGSVKNSYDGSVIVEAQGTEENLNYFLNTLESGNRFANVEDIEISYMDLVENETKFKITY